MRSLVALLLLLASSARADFVLSGAAEKSLEQLFDIPSGQIVVFDAKCKTLPAPSKTGRVKIACDSSVNQLKASINGGAFNLLGGGGATPAGSVGAIQNNAGSSALGDSGCTGTGGAMTCTSFATPDQNNAGQNYLSIYGNGASTTPAVDCATIGASKRMTLANTNKTDTESARIYSFCFGTGAGLTMAAAAPAGNRLVNAAAAGLSTCGDASHSCALTVDANGTLTVSSVTITATSLSPTAIDIIDDFTTSAPLDTGTYGPLQLSSVGTRVCTGGIQTSGSAPMNSFNAIGIFRQTTDGTAQHTCLLTVKNHTALAFYGLTNAATNWFLQTRLTMETQTNEQMLFGFVDNSNELTTAVNNYPNAIGIRQYSGENSGHYGCYSCAGSTCDSADTGIAPSAAGTLDVLRVDMSDSTHVRCTINGTAFTKTGNIPATTVGFKPALFWAATTTTPTISMDIDYLWWHYLPTR